MAALLTTINEEVDRVAMHGVRRAVLEAQAAAAGLPLRIISIPYPCPNDVYEVADALRQRRTPSPTASRTSAFGDLFLEDIRRYREERLAGSGSRAAVSGLGHADAELARR